MPLVIPVREEFSFANFLSDGNDAALAGLKGLIVGDNDNDAYIYLWGKSGVGVSHLLQATCQEASEQGLSAIYLPMTEIMALDPQLLINMESVALVCIDDIERVVGSSTWQEALFHLFNRIKQNRTALVVAGHQVPSQCGIELQDLVSRLASGVTYQIRELSDAGKQALLKQRGRRVGLELSDEVCRYLLNRAERGVPGLLQILERLDRNALSSRRKITIPFVRDIMGW